MAQQMGSVYGSTTASGARARAQLQAQDVARQAQTLREFVCLQGGLGAAGKLNLRACDVAREGCTSQGPDSQRFLLLS